MIVYERIECLVLVECLVLDWIIECLVLDWISGVTQLTEGNAFLLCSVPTAVGQKQTCVLVPRLFQCPKYTLLNVLDTHVSSHCCWSETDQHFSTMPVSLSKTCLVECSWHTVYLNCFIHFQCHPFTLSSTVVRTEWISVVAPVFSNGPEGVRYRLSCTWPGSPPCGLCGLFLCSDLCQCCNCYQEILFYHHYQIHQTPTPLPFWKPSNSCYFQYHDCVTTLRQIWNVKWLCPFFMPPAPVCFKIIFMYYTFWIIYLLSCE